MFIDFTSWLCVNITCMCIWFCGRFLAYTFPLLIISNLNGYGTLCVPYLVIFNKYLNWSMYKSQPDILNLFFFLKKLMGRYLVQLRRHDLFPCWHACVWILDPFLDSFFFVICLLGSNRQWLKRLGPFYSCRRAGMNSWIQDLAWP